MPLPSFATRPTGSRRSRRSSHGFRNMLLILVGVAIGIFFNPFTGPETRRWVKGRVSGGEFSYNGQEQAETVTAY